MDKRQVIFLVVALILPLLSRAESKLPELITKQDIKNIRFVSDDGKFTYYQRHTGSLQFSTNYKVEEIIKLEERTHYNVITSKNLKYLFVEADTFFNTRLSLKKLNKLYVVEYGTKNSKEIGAGIAIGLHVNDQYVSYYNPYKRVITIQNHYNPSVKTEIKMANAKNPYFIPSVVMLDIDTVIYTDLNKDGVPGVLLHKINSRKTKVVDKLDSPDQRVEICLNGGNLNIAVFGLDPVNKGSYIYQLDQTKLNPQEKKMIYETDENDIGNLVCRLEDNKLFFIKTTRSEVGKLTYDAWELETTSKALTKLSDVDFATSLTIMDKKLILPYQNKHYILRGESDLTKFDKLKAKPIGEEE